MKSQVVVRAVKGDEITLSPVARSLWAKTGSGEQRYLWSPLYVHLLDTMNVAGHLWNEWLAWSVRLQIADELGTDDAGVRTFVCWLAGAHDIGKATPNFQRKVPELAERVQERGLSFPPSQGVKSYSHDFMGELIFRRWLKEGRGWRSSDGIRVANEYASVIGGHHGLPADDCDLDEIERRQRLFPNEVMGDEAWSRVQEELLCLVFEVLGLGEYEPTLRAARSSTTTLVLLNGLVIMADWIASNGDLFPLVDSVGCLSEFRARVLWAWERLALPSAWRPVAAPDGLNEDGLFRTRFPDLPPSSRLRPAQRLAVEAAASMQGSGLLIIEAPMGSGKTEASLLCAELMASKCNEGGVAYLLPTMATSNAMFARVERWLEFVPDVRGASRQSMQLLHSKAELNGNFTRLREWRSTWMGDKGGAEESIIAHQWFGGRKRGLLASFVVGTVDQLLMAALKTRHVQLRQLGLAGKVVVIDEVHAYDAYMNVYLDRALSYLGSYGVPVILLSATLPPSRREELIRAYRGEDGLITPAEAPSLESCPRPRRRRARQLTGIPPAPRNEDGSPSYPLITAVASGKERLPSYSVEEGENTQTSVSVSFFPDDGESLVGLLLDLLGDGGCACVLRDTVGRAQETYDLLEEVFGSDVTLVHSRFVGVDRMENDARLLRLLGTNAAERPYRLIVVGTQVLEQSLDIDFDVMVTDVAPIDLLLQRMGRLHRHERGTNQDGRPPKLRQARCFVVGCEDWGACPPKPSKGVKSIYEMAVVWRSILALRTRMQADAAVVSLPRDIALLVEEVYEQRREIPDSWRKDYELAESELAKHTEDKRVRASAWLLNRPENKNKCRGLDDWMLMSMPVSGSRGDAELRARAAVRDTQDSIEVVTVQRKGNLLYTLDGIERDEGGHPMPCRLLGNGADEPDDEAARLAALCTVSLPPLLSLPPFADAVISSLEKAGNYDGWQRSRWLRGALPLVLDERGIAEIATDNRTFRLRYSHERGLELLRDTKDKKSRKPRERGEP